MFIFAIVTGIFSYLIYFAGFFGLLNKIYIVLLFLLYLVTSLLIVFKFKPKIHLKVLKKIDLFLILLIIVQVFINFIGVLGPEISFDALWYHLTLPRLFLENERIFYIPGGLYYYSLIPKLVEMLYIPGILFFGSLGAKIVHFTFGILVFLAIYSLARRFVSRTLAIVASLIFYSNLVVGWETITAYIDLGRAFYELLAFYAFVLFFKSNKQKYLILSSIFLGLAISSKVLAITSIAVFVPLILFKDFRNKQKVKFLKNIVFFVLISLLIPLPYFIYSFVQTGNPIYPFFTSVLEIEPVLNLMSFPEETWKLFTSSSDPISPVYLIFIPLAVYYYKNFDKTQKLFVLYSLISILVWFVTPRTGGGRFILPYLPVFSILIVLTINLVKKDVFRKYLLALIVICSLVSIGYRALANLKFVPVILGRQTTQEFLIKHLDFEFGNFIDMNNEIKKNSRGEKVLIVGGHNLFYADFPFVHESYYKKSSNFKYVLTIKSKLPSTFKNYSRIYENSLTHATLYIKGKSY